MNYLLPAVLFLLTSQQISKPFTIEVVDKDTGRGVPLVELRTVNGIRLFTDSAGICAFNEPGVMNQEVYFFISSHGYEFPADGFGYRGKKVPIVPGGSIRLQIKRINIAERLYRTTGGGIYRDSILTGKSVPLKEPVLGGHVFGCDSVVNMIYKGKMHWFYGDTNRPAYPLGNFHASGAVSDLPGKGGLDPAKGIDLRWFVDDKQFAKPMAPMPGTGPTWITSLVVLPDEKSEKKLFASYIKIKPPLSIYARGIARYDEKKDVFEPFKTFDIKSPVHPSGHSFHYAEEKQQHLYFNHPLPLTRVKETLADFTNPASYEGFTCLTEGSSLEKPRIDRDKQGRIRWSWKKTTPPIGPAEQSKLIADGHIKRHEGLIQLRDRDTGKPVQAHSGSVYFNSYRNRWVMIAVEFGGTSFLGEVWYSEAISPTGPWVYAKKVATHNKYSFYNPKHHPMFDQEKGRLIYFEGTYTHTFSGNSDATPRYDYNQVMYRLDLKDERLAIPGPIYSFRGGDVFPDGSNDNPLRMDIKWFALDRPIAGTMALVKTGGDATAKLQLVKPALLDEDQKRNVQCYVYPPDFKSPSSTITPLYEYVNEKFRLYSTDKNLNKSGYKRSEKPVAIVWKNPWRAGAFVK